MESMNRKGIAVVTAGAVILLIMVVVNALQIGGRDMIMPVNNLTLFGFAAFAAVQALIYWRSLQNREEAKRVWLMLGLGMALYGLGQLSWMVYNLIGIDVPYPSIGDFFWVPAYSLLVIGVVNKIILLGVRSSQRQIATAVFLGILYFLWIGNFILFPMLEDAGNVRVVETLLNFFYPVMDFLVLAGVTFLVIVLWKGRLSLTWNIVAAGFVFMAVADVLFIYATWNGLYYAEGSSVNFLTRGIDVAYTLSFFLLFSGIYLQQWAATIQPETIEFEFTRSIASEQSKTRSQVFTPEMQAVFDKIFFMVDDNQNVYFFSHHYRELCQLISEGSGHVVGTPLHSVLGLDKHVVSGMFAESQPGRTKVIPVEVVISSLHIPAVVRVSPARNGSDVFLQYRYEDKLTVPEESKSIEFILVEDALRLTQNLQGSDAKMREASAFFLIEVQEMYLFLVRMGGYRVGQVLVERFNREAAAQNADVRITDGRVVLTCILDTRSMSRLLQLTLKTIQELTSTEATSNILKLLSERIPPGIIRSAQDVGVAL